MRKLLFTILLLGAAGVAAAQWGPPVPSPLALAAIPGLSSDQQTSVRKILLQHRDAIEALASKEHADFEAIRQRARAERERADDATDANLRKLLGDDGYRKFADWHVAQHGPHGPGPGMPFAPGGRGPHPGMGDGAPPPAPGGGSAPGPDGDD